MEKQTWIRIFSLSFVVILLYSTFSLHEESDEVFLNSFNYAPIPTQKRFQSDITTLVNQLPTNEETEKKEAILFVTNFGYEHLTRNAICSLFFTNVPKERVVVLALDEASYSAMDDFGVKTLFYPENNISSAPITSEKSNELLDIVRAKFTTLSLFIENNTDVTVCDSDIVFTQNPFLALNMDTELEVSIDAPNEPNIPARTPYYLGMNLGFYHLTSTPTMKRFMKLWGSFIEKSDTFEHGALHDVIKRMNVKTLGEDSLIIESGALSDDETRSNIKLRYINPIYGVQAIGPLKGEKKKFIKYARQANLSAPYWCHFNNLGDAESKEKFLKENKLWYIDSKGKCLNEPPQGNSWPWWH